MRKTTSFNKTSCRVYDANKKLVATASKAGSLYYLNCHLHQVNVADECHVTKKDVWHRRLGHLGKQSLQNLAKNERVGFDYDVSKKSTFVSLVLRENITEVAFQMMVVNSLKSLLGWSIVMCVGR